MFVSFIDRQLRELNDRFDEVNTELLSCMVAFSPLNSFTTYDQAKLVTLATKFYHKGFTTEDYQNFHGNLLCIFLMFVDMKGLKFEEPT